MPQLARADDHDPKPLDWDQISPAITEAPEGDRRTPPAAERLFAAVAEPWNRQIAALEAALGELTEVRRLRERLLLVRSQLLQASKTEQLAQNDLESLQARRAVEVSRAATAAIDELPRLARKKRVDEARSQAARWFDDRHAPTHRLTMNRLTAAQQKHRSLLDEEQQLLSTTLLPDQASMQFVDEMFAAVSATMTRDREARAQALKPWTQLRGTDQRLVETLRALPDDNVLPGQAFGQGPIHLLIGRHLALVELRRGRDGVRIEIVDGDLQLLQVRPDEDVPLGFHNGSTAELRAAAKTVEGMTGVAPSLVVCVSGWSRDPEQLGDLHLCGPASVTQVIMALDVVDLGIEALRSSANALSARPLPEHPVDAIVSLDHFTSIFAEDVPEGLPCSRDLILLAHERRADEA